MLLAQRRQRSLVFARARRKLGVVRRTELGTLGDPGDAALEAAARLMADCMGWDCRRREEQMDQVRARLRLAATGRAMLAEPAPAAALVT